MKASKKLYYYITDSHIPHQKYFISYNKKSIRQYSEKNHLGITTIFDPTDKPIDTYGIQFVDLTKTKSPTN